MVFINEFRAILLLFCVTPFFVWSSWISSVGCRWGIIYLPWSCWCLQSCPFPIICIITIIKASQLQHTSSEHRNMILNDMFLKERNLMEKISDNHQKMRMIKAKTLLKEVDESIHFEEWIHNPTKILGYTASPNVISSALGIILTGLVLAMEGFAGSGISYDSNGWFNFWMTRKKQTI